MLSTYLPGVQYVLQGFGNKKKKELFYGTSCVVMVPKTENLLVLEPGFGLGSYDEMSLTMLQ